MRGPWVEEEAAVLLLLLQQELPWLPLEVQDGEEEDQTRILKDGEEERDEQIAA